MSDTDDNWAQMVATQKAIDDHPVKAINEIKHTLSDVRDVIHKIQNNMEKSTTDCSYRWAIVIILLAVIAYKIN